MKERNETHEIVSVLANRCGGSALFDSLDRRGMTNTKSTAAAACVVASPELDALVIEKKKTTTTGRKRARSQCSPRQSPMKPSPPARWSSPRRCSAPDHRPLDENVLPIITKSPRKKLFDQSPQRAQWDPTDPIQLQSVREALHVATSPDTVICREIEHNKILKFCKDCVEQEKSGSMYVCGCPGTGKTISIGKVQNLLSLWCKEEGHPAPDVLAINCTSLTSTSEIFTKILAKVDPQRKSSGHCSPLQQIQNIFSKRKHLPSGRMILLIADEMDYLITRDRAVLHDLFMLTTLPFSKCMLIGIANAIDLADRFLPKLESLDCKPIVVTFPAYSKDQILKILQQRLMVLGCDVFQPLALEFCARKVAAASGDMRRALSVCRSAIEVLLTELRDEHRETGMVTLDIMDVALLKAFKSSIITIIQSLPQQQQIILCSLVKLFRQSKKATTIGELNKSYLEMCKSSQIPPVGTTEFADMCRVLSDQGLIMLGNAKEIKMKRITLKIDSSDIKFALKGIRFFLNFLE